MFFFGFVLGFASAIAFYCFIIIYQDMKFKIQRAIPISSHSLNRIRNNIVDNNPGFHSATYNDPLLKK